MHVMMSQEQFDMLKQKTGGGSKSNGKGGEEKLPKLELSEDDDTHGSITTDDVIVDYFYNAAEGRLNFSVSKRKTLAAYCAGDNIIGTYIMDILSAMPNPAPKHKESGAGLGAASGGEQEKKDQLHHHPSNQ